MFGRLLATTVALLCLLCGTAMGQDRGVETIEDLSQDGDYSTSHTGWNGLATFAAVAEGMGLQVVERVELNWDEISNQDLLVLLYPTSYVDPSDILSFVRNGGRVLIGDDFGASGQAMGRLGGQRNYEAVRASQYHDNQSFAPLAYPVAKHPLAQGVESLTTNHPAVLEGLEGMQSVFEFGAGQSVVATGRIGDGRFIALADPSVLINRMLQFEGNLQFSINLLRYLQRGATGAPVASSRVVVLTGDVGFLGHPRNHFNDGTWRGEVSAFVNQLDAWLYELNEYYGTPLAMRVLAASLAVVVGFLLFFALPSWRFRPFDQSFTRGSSQSMDTGHASLLSQYDSTSNRGSYLLIAAIERDNVNAALERCLEVPDPLYGLREKELVGQIRGRCGDEAAARLSRLLPRLRHLPQRAQAAAHWQPRHLSHGEFVTLHRQTQELYPLLGNEETSA